MQEDFHYYATFCAAHLAGYETEQCRQISYCDQLVDLCSKTFLGTLNAPLSAATTQLQLELMEVFTDIIGLQDITRIWASFHFLPRDLKADPGKGGRGYKNKYRLICGPNGQLLADTVELARGRGVQAAGLAMHILSDTWAHQYFAGTPSLVINNVSGSFYEICDQEKGVVRRPVEFRHDPTAADDLEHGLYTNTIYQQGESSVMNLGHGRAGHLPDYSFARYVYMPAWNDYQEVLKDNPSDYWNAFCQMVYALRCLRTGERFELDRYDYEVVAPWERDIKEVLVKRQLNACEDWKELGERMVGEALIPFDLDLYQQEYRDAPKECRDETFLGQFFLAAMAQKSMVTNRIYRSGNLLAGFSIDYEEQGFVGIKDYLHLVKRVANEAFHG